jgi:hypothetical protein
MRNIALKRLIAASGIVVAFGLVAIPATQAQVVAKPVADYWGGRSKAANATCPQIEWTIVPIARTASGTAVGPIDGVAYYSDMSGISKVSGTISAEGKISASMTSVSGNGPQGTVAGMRGAQNTHIELIGAGCANTAFDLPRFQEDSAAGGGG